LTKPGLITNFVKPMKGHGDGSRDLVPKNPCNRPWRPIRLWDVEGPTLSRQ
jgi:hypothetical protein